MSLSKNLKMMARYKAWADALLYQSLAKLSEDELNSPRRIVFGSLLRTLNHLYAMDVVWQAHLLGKRHGYNTRNPESCPPFKELRALAAELDQWYVRYADGSTEPSLNEVVKFEFIGGNPGSMSRGDILLHVVNHSTYHRGHIADMLYEMGSHPPTTDLPVYLRHASAVEL